MSDTPPLAVIVHSGTFEKVHYALVLASSALATGRPVRLFFTGGACRALTPDWRAMPAEEGSDAGSVDDGFAARGIGTFPVLLSACLELGAGLMVCEMGLKAIGLNRSALDPALTIQEGGAVTFLQTAGADAQLLLV
ncbi:MAG: hypothetical protein ACPGNT_02625 [Rhodospirillales bacterium]